MGFESNGLARVALALLFGSVASWLCLGVLIVVSITGPGNQVALGLLMAWVLIVAVWFAVYPSREHHGRGYPWRQWILMAPALPLLDAVIGVRRSWKR